jgi:hypothetical protein
MTVIGNSRGCNYLRFGVVEAASAGKMSNQHSHTVYAGRLVPDEWHSVPPAESTTVGSLGMRSTPTLHTQKHTPQQQFSLGIETDYSQNINIHNRFSNSSQQLDWGHSIASV